jgi:hypothetical protein
MVQLELHASLPPHSSARSRRGRRGQRVQRSLHRRLCHPHREERCPRCNGQRPARMHGIRRKRTKREQIIEKCPCLEMCLNSSA